jgi:gas vesicle protein
MFLFPKKRKEDDGMAEKGSDYGNFLRGLLIGGFLGALAGILFAPKSGKEMRAELKEKGHEAFGEAKDFYSDARSKAKAILDDARHRAEELKKEAERQLTEGRQKAQEILAGEEKRDVAGEEEARKKSEA